MGARAWCLFALVGCGRLDFATIGDAAFSDGAADVSPVADASPFADAIAHWPFDEGSGMSAFDATGNGHTISLVNGPTWVPGHTGTGVASTGTTEYLVSNVIDLSATSAVTVSLWVNRTYTVGPRHTLFEHSDNFNSHTDAFGLFPDDSTTCVGGYIMLGLMGDAGYNEQCFTQPTSGAWHHLVAVYDKSQPGALEQQLYIDGVGQAVQVPANSLDNTNTFGVYQLFVLSRDGTAEFNAGIVDELAIWPRALTAAEIAAL
jgi:hypothetical protein